ncbi:MAG: hypothetical protein AB7F86_12210 [Bdellovibrionales bacterium]
MNNRQIELGGTIVQTPNTITHKLEFEGIHLLLFDPQALPTKNRGKNIWAFDSKGKFLWEVQPLPLLDERFKYWWISLYLGENSKVVAMNCDDAIFHVDPKTGDLYRTDGVKIPRVRTIDEWMKLIGEDT